MSIFILCIRVQGSIPCNEVVWFVTQRKRSERGPSRQSDNVGGWELQSCYPDHKIKIGFMSIFILCIRVQGSIPCNEVVWFITQRKRSERGPSRQSDNVGGWELQSCYPDQRVQIARQGRFFVCFLILTPSSRVGFVENTVFGPFSNSLVSKFNGFCMVLKYVRNEELSNKAQFKKLY
jgi:hypothetical protein